MTAEIIPFPSSAEAPTPEAFAARVRQIEQLGPPESAFIQAVFNLMGFFLEDHPQMPPGRRRKKRADQAAAITRIVARKKERQP